jgi:chromosome segregation ATPase
MSQTRKEIIAQLDAAEKAAAERETAHAAEVKDLTDQLAQARTAADQAAEEIKAQQEAHGKTFTDAQATIEKLSSEIKAHVEKLAFEQAAHAETKKQLDMAKNALANPAFVDAALKACNMDLHVTADAEADRVEKTDEKPVSHLETWESITEPKARRAYYIEHKEAIRAEIKQQGGK